MARKGHSKAGVARALGLTAYKLKTILELMPRVKWVKPRLSIETLAGRKQLQGVCSERQREQLARAQAKRREQLTRTVQGVTGTLPFLCKHFGISRSTLEGRLSRDWSLEEALTRPPVAAGGHAHAPAG